MRRHNKLTKVKKLRKTNKQTNKKGKLPKINKRTRQTRRTRRKKMLNTFKGGSIIMFEIYRDDDSTHNADTKRCMCTDYDKDVNNNMNINNSNGRRCKRTVEEGSDFCAKHRECRSYLKQFTNTYERNYNPDEWDHPYIEGTHNCYSYFLDDKLPVLMKKCKKICEKEKVQCPSKLKKCRNLIPQPGDHHLLMSKGTLRDKKFNYTCDEMNRKILNDNSSIRPSNFFE